MRYPTFTRERKYLKTYRFIAGVDEAGRGPLAGPVVAGAVILDPAKVGAYRSKNKWWRKIADSKQLTAKRREEFIAIIKQSALAFGVGIISSEIIDAINIHQAALHAMSEAISNCDIHPEFVLVDGPYQIPNLPLPQETIIAGDVSVLSIAVASILAKITRDALMVEIHQQYPQYRFDKHKGYATKLHQAMIDKYGLCPLHRRSFIDIKNSNI